MIVVSDTSPINYLVQIEQPDLLPLLFGEVFVPSSVLAELRSARSPEAVLAWCKSIPPWLRVRDAAPSAVAWKIDRGEADAIGLARETGATLLLVDDREGRKAAVSFGLVIMGTLGVLGSAAEAQLIDFSAALDALTRTNFRASPRLIADLRERFA